MSARATAEHGCEQLAELALHCSSIARGSKRLELLDASCQRVRREGRCAAGQNCACTEDSLGQLWRQRYYKKVKIIAVIDQHMILSRSEDDEFTRGKRDLARSHANRTAAAND